MSVVLSLVELSRVFPGVAFSAHWRAHSAASCGGATMGIKEFIAAVMGAYPHVRTPWTFNTYVGARGDIYYTANTGGISVVSPEPGRLDAWSVSHDDADTTFGKTLEEAVGLMHLRRIADS